ncbi:MAG: endonuclease/exonuclease/phosphatase family protein [Muribaculaceae bacterium]|nr:endonuclease/exonuclease/phosphatase family protein [Muribaculaceae bacterium]
MRTSLGITGKIAMALTLLLSVLTLIAAYGGKVPPTALMSIPALGALAFPALAIALAILIIVDCFIAPRAALAGFLILVFGCWSPLRANFPINLTVSPDTPHDFRLLTYNVAYLRDFSGADTEQNVVPSVDYAISRGADIVALQEFHMPSKKYRQQLKKEYPYIAVSSDGQALLSKWPVKELGALGSGYSFPFIVQGYQVSTDRGDLTIVNVHLRSIGLTETDKELYENMTEGHKQDLAAIRHSLLSKLKSAFIDRATEAEVIRSFIDSVNGPVIVCGDFNDVPLCYAQRVIMGNDMKDAYRETGRIPSITFRENRMYFRIDHILYNDGLAPTYTVCEHVKYSDHYPVITNFKFTNQ